MSPEKVFNVILNEVKGLIVILSETADLIFIMNKIYCHHERQRRIWKGWILRQASEWRKGSKPRNDGRVISLLPWEKVSRKRRMRGRVNYSPHQSAKRTASPRGEALKRRHAKRTASPKGEACNAQRLCKSTAAARFFMHRRIKFRPNKTKRRKKRP